MKIALFLLTALFGYDASAQVWQVLLDDKRDGSTFQYSSISCSDSRNCTVAGYSYTSGKPGNANKVIVERTTDGGASWVRQSTGLPDYQSTTIGPNLDKVFAIDSANIVAVGDSGIIVQTTDAGKTWIRRDASFKYGYNDVHFLDSLHGAVAGILGTVAYTSDGGLTWRVTENLTNSAMRLVRCVNDSTVHVYGRGNGKLFISSDRGFSWDSIQVFSDYNGSGLGGKYYRGVDYLDENRIILAGGNALSDTIGNYKSLVVMSLDGGRNWDTVLNSFTPVGELFSVEWVDENTIYISGRGKWLGYSMDKGVTWSYDSIADSKNWIFANTVVAPSKDSIFLTASYGLYGFVLRKIGVPSGVKASRYISEFMLINPNPASNKVEVWFRKQLQQSQLLISDILGRLVTLIPIEQGANHLEIDINNLSPGVYLGRIGMSSASFIKR